MKSIVNHAYRSLLVLGVGCLAVVLLSSALFAAGDNDQRAKAAQAAAKSRGARIKVEAAVESPKLIAVRVRHDMCPFCKAFDSQFPELIRESNDKSVLFVTLDLTSKATQQQAALIVGALGLERVWPGDLSNMGTITFVDGKSKRIISEVYQLDMKTVETALREAVESVRGNH